MPRLKKGLLPKSKNITLYVPGGQAGKQSEGSFIRRENEILLPRQRRGIRMTKQGIATAPKLA